MLFLLARSLSSPFSPCHHVRTQSLRERGSEKGGERGGGGKRRPRRDRGRPAGHVGAVRLAELRGSVPRVGPRGAPRRQRAPGAAAPRPRGGVGKRFVPGISAYRAAGGGNSGPGGQAPGWRSSGWPRPRPAWAPPGRRGTAEPASLPGPPTRARERPRPRRRAGRRAVLRGGLRTAFRPENFSFSFVVFFFFLIFFFFPRLFSKCTFSAIRGDRSESPGGGCKRTLCPGSLLSYLSHSQGEKVAYLYTHPPLALIAKNTAKC